MTADPFDSPRVATDVLWTAAHIWVAVHSKGVWRADDPAGPFTKVDLPDLNDGRISLGASADGSVVYALGAGPRLWRITGTTATRVVNVPAALFGGSADAPGGEEEEERPRSGSPRAPAAGRGGGDTQQDYDMVVAVDPDHPDVVVLGGVDDRSRRDASLFKCTVQNPGAASRR